MPTVLRTGPRAWTRRHDRGSAVVLVFLLAGLFSALGLGLMLNLTVDRLLAANFRDAASLRLAAEAALDLALHDLRELEHWNAALQGTHPSSLRDGPASGSRPRPGGGIIDLIRATAEATCGRASCDEASITAVSEARPWGVANPRWRLFAWGRATTVSGVTWPGDPYVLVWVADDPEDADGDPGRDAPAGVAGSGQLLIRAQAFGRGAAQATVEALVRHRAAADTTGTQAPGIRVQSWRSVP